MNNPTQQAPVSTLILGGTGKTGSRIAQRLRSMGVATRIGSRSESPAFDWEDSANWKEVLQGIKYVYLNFAPDLAIPGASQAINLFMDLAVAAGVERVVLLSGRGEQEAQHCETLVQRDEINWTVIRASWFAQNFSEGAFAQMIIEGNVFLPAGQVKEPFIDIDDIAEIAASALTTDKHARQIYEVTGNRLLSFAEAVAEIAKASGRDIRYTEISREDFIAGAKTMGYPEDVLWLLDYLFGTVLDGRNEYLSDGVKRALNREPSDFSEYARKLAASAIWTNAA